MANRSLQEVLQNLSGAVQELQEMLSPFLGGTASVPTVSRRLPGRPRKSAPAAVTAPVKRGRKPAKAAAGQKKTSGATSNGRALQGRYMGVIRSLTASQKKEVKALRTEKGVEAAIARAQELKG